MVDSKDLVIERLQKENASLKKQLEERSYEDLVQKIETLKSQVEKKDQEIKDLKESAKAQDSGGSRALQTKMIVLQSKVRKKDERIEELEKKVAELEKESKKPSVPQVAPMRSSQDMDILKRQLEQERRTVERLRSQMGSQSPGGGGGSARLKTLEIENKRLKSQLASASNSGAQDAKVNQEIEKLKEEVSKRDNEIAQMEAAMARTGQGTHYLAVRRYKRKIEELEGQIKIMKRSEKEMRKRYEEAMLRAEFADEDEGW